MRTNSKKFPLILLFSAMMLVLAACGSGGGSAQGGMENDDSQKSAEMADQDSGQSMDQNTDKKMEMDENKDDMGDENKKQDGMDKKQSATDSTGSKKSDSEDMSSDSDDNTAKKEEQSDSIDRVLDVTAHDFAFNKEKFVAKSGEITVHFKSVEGTHGFAIYKSKGSTEKLLNITGKGTKTVDLDPGKYYIHCSVVCGGGHGNMDAILIVKG